MDQFSISCKRSKYERHSYIFNFKTTGDGGNHRNSIEEMTPSFRGFKVRYLNFNQDDIQQIGFLKASRKIHLFD